MCPPAKPLLGGLHLGRDGQLSIGTYYNALCQRCGIAVGDSLSCRLQSVGDEVLSALLPVVIVGIGHLEVYVEQRGHLGRSACLALGGEHGSRARAILAVEGVKHHVIYSLRHGLRLTQLEHAVEVLKGTPSEGRASACPGTGIGGTHHVGLDEEERHIHATRDVGICSIEERLRSIDDLGIRSLVRCVHLVGLGQLLGIQLRLSRLG